MALLEHGYLVLQLNRLLLVLGVIERLRILPLHQSEGFLHFHNLGLYAFSPAFSGHFLIGFISVFNFFLEDAFEQVLSRFT